MKKLIRNLIALVVLTMALVMTLVQGRIPVVRAEGCPPGQAVGCGCMFTGSEPAGVGVTNCYYLCGGCNGSGEPMYIEQTVQVYD